jgi:menaquinone-dependent protoporphyrinogen IX oxidase
VKILSTAIIYATAHGSTGKAAEILKKHLPDADIFNINTDAFDLSEYDTVVIGSYVRMGVFDKTVRKFVLKYYPHLMKIRTGLFMCSMMPENENKYWKNNYPPQLVAKSVTGHFGCEFDVKKLRGFEKRVGKAVSRQNDEKGVYPTYEINEKAIIAFAEELKQNGIS